MSRIRMSIVLLTSLVMFSASCHRNVSRGDVLIPVTISVTQTASYCGGAAPPDYLLRELSTPRPLSSQPVFIRQGNENDVTTSMVGEYTSDASGLIELALKPGTYCVVFENRKDRDFIDGMMKQFSEPTVNYSAVDKDCLEAWLRKPELVFEVRQDGPKTFTVNYHSPCSWNQWPCVSYFGPLPP